MKNRIFPNFWQAVLIISCWAITNRILFEITLLIIIYRGDSNLWRSIQVIVIELNFIPYIIYIIKKSNINIWNHFSLPDFKTLFKIIIVSLLFRLVISLPMYKPIEFFKLLMDSKIKLHVIDYNNKYSAMVIALRWIFIPIIEEILYRGLILKQFLQRYNPTTAILLSSLIYSFAHLSFERSIYLFVLGVILGIFYLKTNSILASSIVHFIFNMAIVLRFKELNLSSSDFIVYSTVFSISILIVIYLLKKPMNTNKMDLEMVKNYFKSDK